MCERLGQARHDLEHEAGRHRIELGRRLIGQDPAWIANHCGRKGQALLLAARELGRPVVGPDGQADPLEQIVDLVGAPPAELGRQLQVLAGREVVQQVVARLLEDERQLEALQSPESLSSTAC